MRLAFAINHIIMLSAFSFVVEQGIAQKIYQAESPGDAQVMVYPADELEEADLLVCFVWDEKEITRTGLWMDMRYPHEADVIIFFVDEEKEADLKIWLVDTQEESKWLNQEKSKLLRIKKTPE